MVFALRLFGKDDGGSGGGRFHHGEGHDDLVEDVIELRGEVINRGVCALRRDSLTQKRPKPNTRTVRTITGMPQPGTLAITSFQSSVLFVELTALRTRWFTITP